jgi:16S rRNA (cytidine1402-2'-O)-methyltransferase
VPVSFTCRGHAGISGTHDKTLEFTRDRSVTRRATCVLGVASDHDDAALRALRGDVEVTLTAGSSGDSFRAAITPLFLGDDSLVFRCGPALHGRTLGYDATKSAADLDRALVRALGQAETELTVTIRELGRGDRRGVLWVVAVPIGNDDDLSPRARHVLEAADVLLAEDTRRFRDLARRAALTVEAPVLSYHEHNEDARAGEVLERLEGGARVALVSDAGTPLCSDPGYVVVHRAVDAGFEVTPVPGPSSLLAVLSASGLPADRFTYVGFLPRRAAARRAELRRLVERREPFVVHEAPHRVAALLDDLAAVGPEWRVCAGREVTKVFEEFRRGSARELRDGLGEPRGEYTLVVAPPQRTEVTEPEAPTVDVDRLVRALLAQGVTTKSIAHALAELPGLSRKEAYARVLAIAEQQ